MMEIIRRYTDIEEDFDMAVKMLNDEETAFFCEQLAMIMEAGIPLTDGIEILADEAGDKRFKEIAFL